MKIAVIVPNVGMTSEALAERAAFLQSIARPRTKVALFKNEQGPPSIESEVERDEASVHIVSHIRRLSGQGFDAFIPWCAADPGVYAAREVVDVPVVGPLHASCLYAALLGYRFTLIVPRSDPRPVIRRVRSLGFADHLGTVRQIDRTVPELRGDLPATRALLQTEIAAARSQDGADAVVLGCMGLFGVAATLDTPIPVIDPGHAALATAEDLVAMRLRHAAHR